MRTCAVPTGERNNVVQKLQSCAGRRIGDVFSSRRMVCWGFGRLVVEAGYFSRNGTSVRSRRVPPAKYVFERHVWAILYGDTKEDCVMSPKQVKQTEIEASCIRTSMFMTKKGRLCKNQSDPSAPRSSGRKTQTAKNTTFFQCEYDHIRACIRSLSLDPTSKVLALLEEIRAPSRVQIYQTDQRQQ